MTIVIAMTSVNIMDIHSGKRLHNYGTSPLLMGISTMSLLPLSIAMLNYQSLRGYTHTQIYVYVYIYII